MVTTTKSPPRAVRLINPVARQVAGRRWFRPWAVLHHVGRRSGTDYAVPVAVLATPTTFVIGMPWGERTDWVRNVIAAGGCTMRWRGVDQACTRPRIVGTEVALAAAGPFQRFVISRVSFPGFLELQRKE